MPERSFFTLLKRLLEPRRNPRDRSTVRDSEYIQALERLAKEHNLSLDELYQDKNKAMLEALINRLQRENPDLAGSVHHDPNEEERKLK